MSEPDREGIFELSLCGRKSAALFLAVGSGLFDEIMDRALSCQVIVDRLALHPGAARILLGLLRCLGFVEETVDGFSLHPEMRAALAGPWGPMVRLQAQMFFGTNEGREWLQAARGERFVDPTGWSSNPAALTLYPEAMRRAGGEIALRTLRKLRPLPPQGVVLDVGGGTGTFGMPLLRLFPAMYWIVIDLLPMESAARSVAENEGAQDRYEFIAHDVRGGLPDDARSLDLIIFSQILHLVDAEARTRLLLEGVARLAPGGKMAIIDFFPNRADNMLIPWLMAMDWLRYGTMFHESAEDVAAMLAQHGMATVASSLGPAGSTLIVATRRE